MNDRIELISFDLCPFVQRSVITLLEKDVPYDITFIDLSDKPDWFLKISPTGKVPVLRIGQEVLFESVVINEYLDEITPPSLHPSDPLIKAKHRGWIEFGSTLMMTHYRMMMAKDEASFRAEQDVLQTLLNRLENQIGDGPFFEGERFSLVDAAIAPLLMRMEIEDRRLDTEILDGWPKLSRWTKVLVNRESVMKSVIDGFEDKLLLRLRNSDSWIAS